MFNKKRTSLEKDLGGNKSDAGTKLMTDRLGALERQITSLMQMQRDRQVGLIDDIGVCLLKINKLWKKSPMKGHEDVEQNTHVRGLAEMARLVS